MNVEKATSWGSKLGLVYLILYVPTLILSALTFTGGLDIINAAFGLITNGCYLFLIFGLLKLADERKDRGLVRLLMMGMVLVVLLICTNLVLSFRDSLGSSEFLFIGAFYLLGVFLIVGFGIMNILVAKHLSQLQNDYGEYAKKAAKWNKISGWLNVTLVLSPLGQILSFVADYYIWRIVQQRSRETSAKYTVLAASALVLAAVSALCIYFAVNEFERPRNLSQMPNSVAWNTYTEPFFTVQFPQVPSSEPSSDGNEFTSNNMYISTATSTTYMVEVAQFNSTTNVSDPDALFQDTVQNVLAEPGNEIATSSSAYLHGDPAFQLAYFDSKDNQYIKTILIFWDGTKYKTQSRYYGLTEVYSKGNYVDSDFNRFVNAFNITTPAKS